MDINQSIKMETSSRHEIARTIRTVMTEPAVLLSLGDTFLAAAAAEISGFLLNAASAAVAIVGGVYLARTGKKIGLGFYSAAGVSAYTVCSILYRGAHENALLTAGTLLPALAFFCWTVANAMVGWRDRHHTYARGLFDNEHFYFSLGATAAGSNNPLSTAIFAFSLFEHEIRKKLAANPDTARKYRFFLDFLHKHVTPLRLRGTAYAVSAVAAIGLAAQAPESAQSGFYVLAYATLMLGNFSFDRQKNKCIYKNFSASARTSRIIQRTPALVYQTPHRPFAAPAPRTRIRAQSDNIFRIYRPVQKNVAVICTCTLDNRQIYRWNTRASKFRRAKGAV